MQLLQGGKCGILRSWTACSCATCGQVYGILTTQLLVMFGGVLLFTENSAVKQYVQENPATLWIAYVLMYV